MKKGPIQRATGRQRRNMIIYVIVLAVVGVGAVGLKAYHCVIHEEKLESNKQKIVQQRKYTDLFNEMSIIDLTLSEYMRRIRVIQGFKGYTGLTEEMVKEAEKLQLRIDCSEPILKSKGQGDISFMQPVKISGRYENMVDFYKYLVRKEQIRVVKPNSFKVTDSNNLECNIDLMILVHDTADANGKKKGV